MEPELPESDEPGEATGSLKIDWRAGLPRVARITVGVVLGLFALSIFWVLCYRFAGPPGTYLTRRDRLAGIDVDRRPVPLESISPHLWFAVMTAEDQGFCLHHGFDWAAIEKAQDFNAHNRRTRGASTISMQTSKNAFLWPNRSWPRKGFEAYYTVLIEIFWPKRRILEVYLNVAEWGEGVYGAEAAAQHYFGKSAARLTKREAALLAAALPTPLRSNPSRPSRYLRSRATSIQLAMDGIAREFGQCLMDS